MKTAASRRDGKYLVYRLAAADVAGLWVSLRQVAQAHLAELRLTLKTGSPIRTGSPPWAWQNC